MDITRQERIQIIAAVAQAVISSDPKNVRDNPPAIAERVEAVSAVLIGRLKESRVLLPDSITPGAH
jgi:hypothetical protein